MFEPGDLPAERGQVFSLEGVLAAIVVVSALVFALQTVVVTPSTSGESTAPIQASQIESLLKDAAESGTLKRAILFWNEDSANGFHGTGNYRYYTRNEFQAGNYPELLLSLRDTLDETASISVALHYHMPSGDTDIHRLVDGGAPGEGAVRGSTTVALYDGDVLLDSTGDPTDKTIATARSDPNDEFYAPDVSGSTDLFNVVEVEMIVW